MQPHNPQARRRPKKPEKTQDRPSAKPTAVSTCKRVTRKVSRLSPTQKEQGEACGISGTSAFKLFSQLLPMTQDAAHILATWSILPDSGKFLLISVYIVYRFCCRCSLFSRDLSHTAGKSSLSTLLLDALFVFITHDHIYRPALTLFNTSDTLSSRQVAVDKVSPWFLLVLRVVRAVWTVSILVQIPLALDSVLYDPDNLHTDKYGAPETSILVSGTRREASKADIEGNATCTGAPSQMRSGFRTCEETLTWLTGTVPVIFRAFTSALKILEGPSVEVIKIAISAADAYTAEHSAENGLRLLTDDRVARRKIELAAHGREHTGRQAQARRESHRLCQDMRELRRRTRCLLDQLGQMSRTLCDRRNTQVIRVCELRALDEPLSLDVMLEEVSKVEELQKDVDRFGYELEKLLATRLEWNVIDRRRCAIEALVNGDMNGRDFSADTSTETLCNMDAPIDTPTSPRSSCTTRSDGTVDVSGDSKAVVLYNPCLLLGRRSAHPLKTQCTERPTEVSFGPLRTPALGRAEVWDDVQ